MDQFTPPQPESSDKVAATFGFSIRGKETWTLVYESNNTTMESVRKMQAMILKGFGDSGMGANI